MTRTTLFKTNRSQAVRLPKDVAFPDTVTQVVIYREGSRRVILPATAAWDDFFAEPGIDLPARQEPEAQARKPL